MSGDFTAGGLDATHLSIKDAQLRADRDAAAVRFLIRTGNDDLLPILGLAPEPGRCVHCGRKRRTGTGYCSRPGCQRAAMTSRRSTE